MKFLILNGPNLNLLGLRQPDIYGEQTMEECLGLLAEKYHDHNLLYYQSNHEGDLIDQLHHHGFNSDGIVLNAGAYTHTSIAIADAVAAITSPVVEMHISDISKREAYRNHSYLSGVCCHSIAGKGMAGYDEAIAFLSRYRPGS